MKRLSPSTRELMQQVADGNVWQRTDRRSFIPTDPVEWVTAQVAALEHAGWARPVGLVPGLRQWRLTSAGRDALTNSKEG